MDYFFDLPKNRHFFLAENYNNLWCNYANEKWVTPLGSGFKIFVFLANFLSRLIVLKMIHIFEPLRRKVKRKFLLIEKQHIAAPAKCRDFISCHVMLLDGSDISVGKFYHVVNVNKLKFKGIVVAKMPIFHVKYVG